MILLITYILLIVLKSWEEASLIEGLQAQFHLSKYFLWPVVIAAIVFTKKVNPWYAFLAFWALYFALFDTSLNLFRGLPVLYFGENSQYDIFMGNVHASLVVLWKFMALVLGIHFCFKSKIQ